MIWNFNLRNCFVAILAMCCLISCEKDEIEPIKEESIFPKIRGRVITPKDMKSDPLAYDRLMKYLTKSVAKSSNGIELDTNYIKVIDTDQYSSYTFKIKQDSLERTQVLRNFMLTVVNDTTQIQHLVDYTILNDGSLDMENIHLKRLYGDDLLNLSQPKCGGTSTTWYSYQDCYSVPCIGTGDDKHQYGEACQLDGQAGAPQLVCNTRWASFTVDEPPCATIDAGDSGGGGGGSDGTIIVPVNPTDPDVPCLNNSISDGSGGCFDGSEDPTDPILKDPNLETVKKIVNDPVFQAKIIELQNNLGLGYETGTKLSSINGIVSYTFYEGSLQSPTKLNIDVDNNTTAIGHVHTKTVKILVRNEQTRSMDAVEAKPIPMFSPGDVRKYVNVLLQHANAIRSELENGLRVAEAFTFLVTPNGNYLLKYNGSAGSLIGPPQITNALNNSYRDFVAEAPERSFMTFMEESMSSINFSLYKFDDEGNVSRIENN